MGLKRFLHSFRIYFVIKFYGGPRLIPCVLGALELSVPKIDKNCNFMGLLYRHVLLQLSFATVYRENFTPVLFSPFSPLDPRANLKLG